jgi:hypothetical protein
MWLNKDSDTAIWKLKFYLYLNHLNLLKLIFLNNITNYILTWIQSVVIFCSINTTLCLSFILFVKRLQ